MKYRYILFFILIFFSSSYSQIIYDTTVVSTIGPGVKYYQLKNHSIPWSINIIEADLTDNRISIETIKGGDKIDSLERTSSMARRNNYKGHKVIAAVNADFWRNSTPIGIQILNGEFIKTDGTYSRIYFDKSNHPFIDKIFFSGRLFANGASAAINGVNSSRDTNGLIIYNKYKGLSTKTSCYGTEAVLSPLEDWAVNDTIDFRVDDIYPGKGDTYIPSGKIILSGSGASEKFIANNLKSGGKIKILFQTGISSDVNIKTLTGGYPRLVDKGVNYVSRGVKEEGSPSGSTRHPRTAAGFSKDSTKLFLFTIDGRQPSSAGMTIMELADFMVQSGVYYGINLDGGGSTTMVVRDSIVNSPSDKGGERRVCNSLQIISSAPVVDRLKKIEINPKSIRIFHGGACQYQVTGRDDYGNQIALDENKIIYRLSSNSGYITSSGFFSSGETADTAYIYAEYNSFKDSAKAITKVPAAMSLSPQNIILDTSTTASFSVYERDMDSLFYADENQKYNWKTSDETIGSVDILGNFRGKKEGTVQVIASGGTFTDTADVNIQIFEGKEEVNLFKDLAILQTSKTNVDSVKTFIESKNGIDMLGIYYEYSADTLKSKSFGLLLDAPLTGTPDMLSIPIQTASQDSIEISLIISDDNNELFHLNGVVSDGGILFLLKDKTAKQNASKFFFPASIKQILFKIGNNKNHGKRMSGRYYIGPLSFIY